MAEKAQPPAQGHSVGGVVRRLLLPHSRRLAGLLFLSFLGAAMEAIGLLLLAVFLSVLLGSSNPSAWLGPIRVRFEDAPRAFLVLISAMYVARAVLAISAAYASFHVSTRVVDDWRMRLLRGLLEAYPRSAESRQGALVQLLMEEPAIATLGLGAAGVFAQNAVATLAIYLVITWLAPQVALALTATAILAALCLWMVSRYSRRVAVQRSTAYAEGYAVTNEVVSALKQLQIFGLQDEIQQRLERALADMRQTQVRSSVITSSPRLIVEVIFMCGLVAVLIAIMPTTGRASLLASSGLAVGAALRLLPAFSASAGTWVQIQQAWPAMKRIDAEIAALESRPHGATGTRTASKLQRVIEFRDVKFSRDGRGEVLRGVSMEIEARSLTALVGPSGAGKSTLVDLLVAVERAESGGIFVDGVDLAEIDPRSWRARLGVVLQDGFLLGGSIRDNLTVLRPDSPSSLLDEVLEVVGAQSFLRDLPGGLDARVGERGVTLSGGQRQRLSLARVLVREPDFLILDEATAALDAVSDSELQGRLRGFRPGMAILSVSHRLASARMANRIHVLEGGRIVESGNHHSLIAAGGLYAALDRSLVDS